jgi:hypothetical protein
MKIILTRVSEGLCDVLFADQYEAVREFFQGQGFEFQEAKFSEVQNIKPQDRTVLIICSSFVDDGQLNKEAMDQIFGNYLVVFIPLIEPYLYHRTWLGQVDAKSGFEGALCPQDMVSATLEFSNDQDANRFSVGADELIFTVPYLELGELQSHWDLALDLFNGVKPSWFPHFIVELYVAKERASFTDSLRWSVFTAASTTSAVRIAKALYVYKSGQSFSIEELVELCRFLELSDSQIFEIGSGGILMLVGEGDRYSFRPNANFEGFEIGSPENEYLLRLKAMV